MFIHTSLHILYLLVFTLLYIPCKFLNINDEVGKRILTWKYMKHCKSFEDFLELSLTLYI